MRLRPPLAGLVPLLAAGSLAIAAGGCGSSGPAAALDPVAQAAEATTRAGGAQLSLSMAIDTGGAAGTIQMSGHGFMNLHAEEGEIFMGMTGASGALPGLPAGRLQISELLADHAVFVGSPLFEGKLPGGARWLKVDIQKAQQALGLEPQQIASGESDPARFLQYLKAAGATVHTDGGATVRGVPTTRYSGSVNLLAAARVLPSNDRAAAESAMSNLVSKIGTSSFPFVVWIDSKHMVRRLRMTIPTGTAGASANIEEELFGFGAIPAVHAPSGGEVYEAPIPSLSAGG